MEWSGAKAAVFKGDCPAAPIIRRMNLPAGAGTDSPANGLGYRRSDARPAGRAKTGITMAPNDQYE
jgi:hypothetical protein